MAQKVIQDLAYQKGIFRFRILGGLLAKPPNPGELTAALKELAQGTYPTPWNGQEMKPSLRTLKRWYAAAKASTRPTEVLQSKVRKDKETERVLVEVQKAWVLKMRELQRDWSVALIYDNFILVAENLPAPSYSTILRFMRKKGLVQKVRRGLHKSRRDVRSFEAEFVGELFHMDFHKGSRMVIDTDGTFKTPICMAIIDDKSRLDCHAQWYLNETTEVLCHGLTQALMKRGLPRCFYTDNGAAMKGEELVRGLETLGIKHSKTLPYSPHQNGKQESFWQPLEGRLMKMIPAGRLKLEDLNQLTQAWIEQDYHCKVHSEIKTAPIERFMKEKGVLRDAPDNETLRKAFRTREKRTVRKNDGTITLDGVRFELPIHYRHLEMVTLKYARWDLGEADVVEESTLKPLHTIYPIDRVGNSSGLRKTLEGPADLPPPATSPTEDLDFSHLPPLLANCMHKHAAQNPLPT
jgi:putative transposase